MTDPTPKPLTDRELRLLLKVAHEEGWTESDLCRRAAEELAALRARSAPPAATTGATNSHAWCQGTCCSSPTWIIDCQCCEGTGETEDGQDCGTCGGVGQVHIPRPGASPVTPSPSPSPASRAEVEARARGLERIRTAAIMRGGV